MIMPHKISIIYYILEHDQVITCDVHMRTTTQFCIKSFICMHAAGKPIKT